MEHFLFDFALNGKPLPLEESDALLRREDMNQTTGLQETGSALSASDSIDIILINGISGKFIGEPRGGLTNAISLFGK